MERRFYAENFENFLKGHADQFKMTPSKKVWHGIYNDLHPGRRWPSVTMSLIFIFTLVIIGHLNTNNGSTTLLNNLTSLQSAKIARPAKTLNTSKKSNPISVATNDNSALNLADDNKSVTQPQQLAETINDQSSSNTRAYVPITNKSKSHGGVLQNKYEDPSEKIENTSDRIENNINTTSLTVDNSANNLENVKSEESLKTLPESDKKIVSAVKETDADLAKKATTRKPKRNNNLTLTYYIAPSFSYRYLSDQNINNAVTHKPAIGYEAGAEMSFTIFKKLSFTSGLLVNYSGYKILANNTHPIMATLILNTASAGQYNIYSTMSHYGNNTGAEFSKIKNYSLQASIPIGLQYVFASTDNLKFTLAAAVQPSLIIASEAYLLSSDKKNYLTAPDLLRNWNMNTSFGTYVSFSSNSLKWQIGPQVRYQVLSTYLNRYQDKEHLVNYGIRLGISKISK